MSDQFTLELCQGKYVYQYEAGKQTVLRNGEPWASMNDQIIGNKFVFSLAVELDEANKRITDLEAKLAASEARGRELEHCYAIECANHKSSLIRIAAHQEALRVAKQLLFRYRNETPLGHQPHMIAHKADEALAKIEELTNA